MLVEDIQDLVEQGLVTENKFHLAKTYIIYRYNRALVRKANTTDESILSLLRNENEGAGWGRTQQEHHDRRHPAGLYR
ncbi:MAG: ATP cone domain-containing protein [Lawsonibacter sp.]